MRTWIHCVLYELRSWKCHVPAYTDIRETQISMKLHAKIKRCSSIDCQHKLQLVPEKAIRAHKCLWSEK